MKLGKTLVIAAAATAVTALTVAGSASAQDRVKWKMHSAWGSSVPHLGTSAVRFSKVINRLSGGSFQMKFFEPGALIPANEGFDATSKGSVDAAWTTAGYD
ncbi:MAG: C4-dicarboxylate ABC transporter, partial [Alphaproteobacteria bacterium]|nr:C4-dicarboxylate ABC transporter [Alphaproteobacteria bacterium]